MKKINKRKISIIFSIITISFVIFNFFGSNVQAEINPETSTFLTGMAGNMNEIFTKFTSLGSITSVFAGLAGLLGNIALYVFLAFSLTFMGGTGSVPPTPDNIVFNNVAILDVNFFNPNDRSILGFANDLIPQLFNTFYVIAISIFVLAAMFAGIKMALSSLASEKAAAKKTMIDWIMGIVVLFLLRLIIAAIFELNEYFVWQISKSAANVTFDVYIFSHQKHFGISWADFSGFMANVFHGPNAINVADIGIPLPGYFGLMAKFAFQAIGGDIFSSILLFILIGQTITLLISYAKRLIYSIILGVVAPLIVAVDTLNKSIKGQSTVFSNWLKEFVSTVFMQSFHSILMLMTLVALNGMYSRTSADGAVNNPLIGIVAIVLVAGIIKFEKMYKQLFGISDGMFGNLKGQTGKLFAGLHGAATGVKAIGDNGKKLATAYKSRKEALTSKEKLIEKRGKSHYTNLINNLETAAKVDPSKKEEYITKAREAYDNAVRDGYSVPVHAKELLNKFQNGGFAQTSNNTINMASANKNLNVDNSVLASSSYGNNSTNLLNNYQNSNGTQIQNNNSAINNNANTTNKESDKIQKGILDEIQKLRKEMSANDQIKSINKEIEDADRKIKSATSDMVSAGLATAMGPANLLMGVGVGIGSGDDLTETALKGGYLTAGLDKASETIGKTVGRVVSGEVKDALRRYDKHSSIDNM